MIDLKPSWKALNALAIMAVLLSSGEAIAAPYSTEIVISTEEEITELYQDGDITSEERDSLLTLFMTPLDLNLASRDELYDLPGFTYTLADEVLKAREERGRFYKIGDLLGVEGMSETIYRQAAVFITVSDPQADEKPYNAQIRLGAIGRVGIPNNKEDDPAGYLRTKIRFLNHGGVGFLFAVRPMNGSVGDARLGMQCSTTTCVYGTSLVAKPEAPRFDPASFHVFWDGPKWSGIAGSYTVGYGMGLTLDNSGRTRRHGWYPNLEFSDSTETGKISPFEGFVGLALRHKQIDLGKGHLDLSVFGSAWNRDLYVYDTYYDRKAHCQPGQTCKKVPALVDEEPASTDPITKIPTYNSLHYDYPTLQGIMRELMGGANATYWINRRSSVGITGYVGNWHMNAEAKDFSPAVSSKYPYDRSTWGVVGANTKFGLGRYDFGAEVAVTDRGDVGALAAGWLRPFADFELIPSFRYYGVNFDNPYNRGMHNGDEFQGNRARDELGGRLQLDYRPIKWLTLKADLNIWYHEYPAIRLDRDETDPSSTSYIPEDGIDGVPSDPATDLEASLRLYFKASSKEKFDLQAMFHDEALDRTGHHLAYSYTEDGTVQEMVPDGDPNTPYNKRAVGWGGQKVSYAVSASTSRIPKTTVYARFKHTFEDTRAMGDDFDQTYYFWFKVAVNLKPGPYIMARFKYYEEYATADNAWYPSSRCGQWADINVYADVKKALGATPLPGSCRGETYMDTYLQISQKLPSTMFAGSIISLRADWRRFTDSRLKWENTTGYYANPSRDEVGVKGYVNVKF